MNAVLAAISTHAVQRPAQLALIGEDTQVSYGDLQQQLTELMLLPALKQAQVVGVALDNCPAWAIFDLALLAAATPVVPLPLFFSKTQITHAMHDAALDLVITDQPALYLELFAAAGMPVLAEQAIMLGGREFSLFSLQPLKASALPSATLKVTYTSGTTGTPKGVCLSAAAINQVAQSLLLATAASSKERHLSLLPLSTLLENIAGLYVPLLAGASCILLSMRATGLLGASGLDAHKMLATLQQYQATSTIFTPEILLGLVTVLEQSILIEQSILTEQSLLTEPSALRLPSLRFIAVGGASVSPGVLARAATLGLPVFEGYGLSECASVVAVNTSHDHKIGSVGKPLPHVQLKFAADGEVIVIGQSLLGYAGMIAAATLQEWATGDIGFLDEDGFLHITGRKKNIFITSYGRNVAPEWVERELTAHSAISQAAVFGEAQPFNVAVIVRRGAATAETLAQAISSTNAQLPDYARVSHWLIASEPFTPQNGLATSNGRLKRNEIYQRYQSQIQAFYKELTHVVL
jgi:long-subunit acyl-CoA synthetase (AMP-forming)